MKKILRIGEFSQINQISIQTLRFYDQIGLLKPYKVDPETNYRYYHINQSSLVDSIQYLRQLNFSLEDIKEILSEKDHFQLHLLTFEIDQNIYQMKSEEYELALRCFKQEILRYSPFFTHFSRVGSIMKQEDFQKERWISKQLCLFHHTPNELPHLNRILLPAGNYAVAYCSSFADELKALPHFHQALTQAGYTPVGDYICEVIHEQPQLQEQHRDMFIRMQVRIEE